ncbi:MAG: formate/nitrite transporter family protein [Acidobacteriota bacterium]
MIDPFPSRAAESPQSIRTFRPILRRLVGDRRVLTATLPEALLGGALLAAGTLLAAWILSVAPWILPLGVARLLAALAFAGCLLLGMACGGRFFGLSSARGETSLGELAAVLVGNAMGALVVAVSLALALRLALFEGFAAALLRLAEVQADLTVEAVLLRATIAGALVFGAREYFCNGERPVDRIAGSLFATIPLVLVGFSLLASHLLVVPFALFAQASATPDFLLLYGLEGAHLASLQTPWILIAAGNLLGSALAAGLFAVAADSTAPRPSTDP